MILKGYHGTSHDSAEKIVAEGFKIPDHLGWLGCGIYFFYTYAKIADGKKNALFWARQVTKTGDPVVLSASIESDRYIDLLENEDHRRLFDRVYASMTDRQKELHGMDAVLDIKVAFQALAEEEIDFIRCPIDANPRRAYYNYVIRQYQVQICVKKPSCISSIRIEEGASTWTTGQ